MKDYEIAQLRLQAYSVVLNAYAIAKADPNYFKIDKEAEMAYKFGIKEMNNKPVTT